MFILYVSGTYMPASGGAEISMYTLLQCLAQRGHRISVFTSRFVPATPLYGSDVGIDVHYVATENLQSALREFCLRNAVELIVSQNLWADVALLFAREAGIPSVYFARAAHGRLDISKGSKYEPTFVIANSNHVASFVRKRWGWEAPVVRPIVRLKDYQATEGSRSYITMINPIRTHKGGDMFYKIARALEEREFLAVQGWGHLRSGDAWNITLLQLLASGLGFAKVWVPQDVDLTGLKNVKLWKSVSDMKRVYGETRLLLVPSTNIEASPRVVIEAMANGIPVIGSAKGGLPEVLSSTGILVHHYENPAAWIEAIVRLDDPATYFAVSSSSRRYVESLDYSSEVSRCASLFRQIAQDFKSHKAYGS